MSDVQKKIEIEWDTLGRALADGVEDLIIFNWEEVYPVGGPNLDVDWPRLLMLERAGIYRAITARRAGKLIGYNGYFIQPPIRHKAIPWAMNDTLYVDPDFRSSTIGLRLLKESLALLKAEGIAYVTHGNLWPDNSTSGKARARFDALLVRMGFEPIETVYVKRL